MSTSDPSQVDTATLLKSLQRDVAEAQVCTHQAHRWLQAASATIWEIQRRLNPDNTNG